MFKYETHLHTAPVSRCARASVRENLEFYKRLGYDGIFITNHFVKGNINIDTEMSYEEKLDFFFSDYKEALRLSEEIGIRVFLGIEISFRGCDFLIYGLEPDWYYAHPEVLTLSASALLTLCREEGALVVHAHPFREASYIDHIQLYPRHVDAVEIYNACRTDFENEMAKQYAENYAIAPFMGSDNHAAGKRPKLGGVEFDTPITSESDFVSRVKAGEAVLFRMENPCPEE